MHFIDVHRKIHRIDGTPFFHPIVIVPLKTLSGRNDPGIVRTALDLFCIGVQLRKNVPVFRPDLKLVKISGTNSRDKQLPYAGISHQTHHIPSAIPAVEIANDRNSCRIGSPDSKFYAINAVTGAAVRPHHIIDIPVFSGVEKIGVHFTDPGQKTVWISRTENCTVRKCFPDTVGKKSFSFEKSSKESPALIFHRERLREIRTGQDFNRFCKGIINTNDFSADPFMNP